MKAFMPRALLPLSFRLAPGLALCLVITLIAEVLQRVGQKFFEAFLLDSLVFAIIMGVALRSLFDLRIFAAGIGFAARFLLELAVMLLGASISVSILFDTGFFLIIAIAFLVLASIAASYGISRLLHLPPRLAFLIACGNAICGNSAIAAVASVIKAKSDEVAPAIAFTAVLGVVAVLIMPLAVPLLSFNDHQYGVFAGMSVYAVPQVLAATMPVSIAASHSGTIVKLVRVLMLGPVIFVISLFMAGKEVGRRHVGLRRLVPWFIIGFALMMGLRSSGLIPHFLLEPIAQSAKFLTIVSMAALGLGVDVRSLGKSGARVVVAASLSLLFLVLGAALFCFFLVK